jgi:hypothetical protein
MKVKFGWFSVSCLALLASVTLYACGDGERPRQLDKPGVLHDNGGSSGSGGSMGQGLGGNDSDGGTGGSEDDEELDAGTGGYQIGTDWDGNTTPTADHAHGIDAAAGEDDRGNSATDAGDGG